VATGGDVCEQTTDWVVGGCHLCLPEIIEDLFQIRRRPDDLCFFVYGATLPESLSVRLAEHESRLPACGASLDRYGAMAAAVAECIERYAFVTWRPEASRQVVRREDEMPGEFAELPFLITSDESPEQYTKKVWRDPNILLCMPDGVSQGPPLPVPVGLVSAAVGAPWAQTTTGMACGTSLNEARCHALLEAVERDTLALAWVWGLRGAELDEGECLSSPIRERLWRLNARRMALCLRLFVSDLGIPVVLAALVRGTLCAPEGVTLGAAASLDIHAAADRAVTEAALAWLSVTDRLRGGYDSCVQSGATPINFAQHAELYSHPAMAEYVCRWLREASEPAPSFKAGLCPSLDDLLQKLHDHERRALFFDMTPQSVADVGLHVTRAIVPGLVPLPVGECRPNHLARFNNPPRFQVGRCAHSAPIQDERPHPFP